jgi:hypothetical protein
LRRILLVLWVLAAGLSGAAHSQEADVAQQR